MWPSQGGAAGFGAADDASHQHQGGRPERSHLKRKRGASAHARRPLQAAEAVVAWAGADAARRSDSGAGARHWARARTEAVGAAPAFCGSDGGNAAAAAWRGASWPPVAGGCGSIPNVSNRDAAESPCENEDDALVVRPEPTVGAWPEFSVTVLLAWNGRCLPVPSPEGGAEELGAFLRRLPPLVGYPVAGMELAQPASARAPAFGFSAPVPPALLAAGGGGSRDGWWGGCSPFVGNGGEVVVPVCGGRDVVALAREAASNGGGGGRGGGVVRVCDVFSATRPLVLFRRCRRG